MLLQAQTDEAELGSKHAAIPASDAGFWEGLLQLL
jgi:hypothetical protein